MMSSIFPYVTDTVGLVCVYRQHKRSGLNKSKWLVLTERSYALVCCSGLDDNYVIEGEEFGVSPNSAICGYIHDLQKQCDIGIRRAEYGSRETESTRTVLLFLNHFLEFAGSQLLNCKADQLQSNELCGEIENSVYQILNGSPASTQIERLMTSIIDLRCFETVNAAAA